MKLKKLIDVPLPGDEIPEQKTWSGALGAPKWHSKPWGMESDEELLIACGQIHDEMDERGIDVNDHDEYRVGGYTKPRIGGIKIGLEGQDGTTVALEDLYPLVMPVESYSAEELTELVIEILGDLESRGYLDETFESTLMSYNFGIAEEVVPPDDEKRMREQLFKLDGSSVFTGAKCVGEGIRLEPITVEAVRQPSVMEHLREARGQLDMAIEMITGSAL